MNIPSSLAVAKTHEVGHAKNSKALKIGEKVHIKDGSDSKGRKF